MRVRRIEPVTEQVAVLLRQRIRDGALPPDNRLPSEAELAEEYGVSRASIRAALSVLGAEQLISRRPGIGTFVNTHVTRLAPSFDSLWQYSYVIEGLNKKASIRTLSATVRTASETEAAALDISQKGHIYALERLFLADDEPVAYSHNIIPIRLFHTDLADIQTDIEIRDFMRHYCQCELTYVTADLGSALPPPPVTQLLGLDGTTPVLHFTQIFYTADSLPVVHADNYHNDKFLRLRVARAIHSSSRPLA